MGKLSKQNSCWHSNFLFIISSPSGTGKTTICRKLLESVEGLTLSISVTTRNKRPNEQHGKDYFFASKEEFEKMIENGELLEHATIFGNNYGTPEKYVQEQLSSGNDVLFDIDWQGARQIRGTKHLDVVSVFLLPPSMDQLQTRLENRNSDSKEIIERRLKGAKDEISHFDEYDYVLINNNLDECFNNVVNILNIERLKRQKMQYIENFIKQMFLNDKTGK